MGLIKKEAAIKRQQVVIQRLMLCGNQTPRVLRLIQSAETRIMNIKKIKR